MLLIDANIFLASENIDDVHHQRAVELWKDIEEGKFGDYFVTDYIFNEVVGVTFRKFGKERATQIGEDILRSTILFTLDDAMLKEAWALFTKTDLLLNLGDCTNITAMRIVGTATLATFDRGFGKVSGIIIVG